MTFCPRLQSVYEGDQRRVPGPPKEPIWEPLAPGSAMFRRSLAGVSSQSPKEPEPPEKTSLCARQGIQTDELPTATFVLAEPIELGSLPAEGEAISVTAAGDLTLHGVRRSVAIPRIPG